MPLRKLAKMTISLMLVLSFVGPITFAPELTVHAALNTSIGAPSGATLDTGRKTLRVTQTNLTAALFPNWAEDYAGTNAYSMWYTDDGSDPYRENPNARRIRINPAVSAAGALAVPRAYIMDYKGNTTYKFITYRDNDWSNIYTYTTAVTAPILELDNNINPLDTSNVMKLTSGLYKRSDVASGIRLYSDPGSTIYCQTAPCTWNPATSEFSSSQVDSITNTNLYNNGNGQLYAGPISASGLDETNAIAIRAMARVGTTNSAAVTFKIRVTDDANFLTLKADKNGNLLVDLDAFIAQLTVEEKVMLCGGVGQDPVWLLNGYNYPIESNNDGILRTGGPAGGTPAMPRFNIPSTVTADGPAGPRTWKNATIWMCPAGVGATWNPELSSKVGERYAEEAKYYAVDYILGPGINNQRNPLSGRNFEYFSEDPYVGGYAAGAQIKAMQANGLAAVPKHFAANDYETGRSNSAYVSERALREIYLRSFQIAVREGDPWALMTGYNGINGTATVRNTWLTTQVLRDEWGFSGFVMSDYGGDTGTGSLESQSDMSQSSPRSLSTYQTWLTGANAARNMGYLNRSVKNILRSLVKTFAFQGEYGVLQTDGTYADGFKLDGTPTVGLTREDIGLRNIGFGSSQVQKDSRIVNKAVADEAIVLLKNEDNTLPLNGNEKVALITSRKAWQEFFNPRWYGDSASVGDVVIQGTGSAQVRFNNSTEDYVLTLKETLEDRGFTVDWKIDFGVIGNNNQAFLNAFYNNPPRQGGKKYVFSAEQAAGSTAELAAYNAANAVALATARINAQNAAAADAAANDVGIFVLTRISGESADVTEALYNMEAKELLVYDAYEKAFHSAGKPMIVLLNVGGTTNTSAYRGATLTIGSGANAVTATTDGADAILDIWNPGSAGTEAVADILKGKVNPSGKLAQTFPVNFNDSPSVYLFAEKNAERRAQGLTAYSGNGWNNTAYYADGVFVGYRFFETRPENYATMVAYPFGYGLSYTEFEYSDLALSKKYVYGEDDTLTATVKVKNIGDVAGKEVVQLYLSASTWQAEGRPKNELKAYGKTKLLAPGESETIELKIKYDDLIYFDDDNSTGTLSPTPTFGRGAGWTVAEDTVFTVTIRTNGSDAETPNQPVAGLTDSFTYGIDYGHNATVESFAYGGETFVVDDGVYDYDVNVPKSTANIAFSATNVTAAYPDDVNVAVTLSPSNGAVSDGKPCSATVTVTSKEYPEKLVKTYTINFGYLTVGDISVSQVGGDWEAKAEISFSDGTTGYQFVYAVYNEDLKMTFVKMIDLSPFGRHQTGLATAVENVAVRPVDTLKIFLWDQNYIPLVAAYVKEPS